MMKRTIGLLLVMSLAAVAVQADVISFGFGDSQTAVVDETMTGYWYTRGEAGTTITPVTQDKTYNVDLNGLIQFDLAAPGARIYTFNNRVDPLGGGLMGDGVRDHYWFGGSTPFPSDTILFNDITVGAGTFTATVGYHLWGDTDPAYDDGGAWGYPAGSDHYYAGTSTYGPGAPDFLAGQTYDWYYDHWVSAFPDTATPAGMTLTLTGDWTGEADFDIDNVTGGALSIVEYYHYWEILHPLLDPQDPPGYDQRTLMFRYESQRTVTATIRTEGGSDDPNDTPEPGTIALLGLVGGAAALVRRRRG